MSPAARGLAAAVRGYRVLRAGRPPVCRFDPTCSCYALEAVTAHGAVRGSWLAVRRIGRCHPWGGMGFDPVPVPNVRSSGARAGLGRALNDG